MVPIVLCKIAFVAKERSRIEEKKATKVIKELLCPLLNLTLRTLYEQPWRVSSSSRPVLHHTRTCLSVCIMWTGLKIIWLLWWMINNGEVCHALHLVAPPQEGGAESVERLILDSPSLLQNLPSKYQERQCRCLFFYTTLSLLRSVSKTSFSRIGDFSMHHPMLRNRYTIQENLSKFIHKHWALVQQKKIAEK